MIGKFEATLEKKLPPGSFARNVVTLMTGTTFAQALMIMVAPILTRIYSPEDFGIFTLYISVLGLIEVIACWRYELAIVLPEKDEDAANILVLSILICFLMAALTLVLVVLFRTSVAKLLHSPELETWLWFLPLSLIAVGLFNGMNYWSTRRKQFKRLAVRQISQSIISSVVQIGIGVMYPAAAAGGMIGGSVVGQLAATNRLALQIARDEGKYIKECLNSDNLKQVLARYKNFPLYDSWSALFNRASSLLPTILLGYFFSPAIVGYYALGNRVLAMPMGVVGSSVAQVFFPQAAESKRNGNLNQLTLDLFRRLLAIGFIPILLITIVAPDLFALIFGDRWWMAGEYLRWLSVWLLFVFISSPLSNIYSVMEKQRAGLIVNIIMFSSRLIVLVIGGITGDALFTIAIFGITGAVLWIFNCVYILHMANVSFKHLGLAMAQQVLHSLPYAAVPILIYWGSGNSLAFVVSAIGVGVIFLMVLAFRVRKAGGLM